MQQRPSTSVSLNDGPFKSAQSLNEDYFLSLSPEKLLAPYYRESGLDMDAERYTNWENSGLDGHTLGHVLSAAAHSARATGNPDATKLVENLVSGLKAAQDHLGTGYVGGIPHGTELWERIASGAVEPDSFGLNGAWVPWYNLHKLFAGLIDAHRELGNEAALDIVIRLANWWVGIARTMTDEAFEAMLRTEFGAMNAAYADLYELTGNPDYEWLAKRFTDRAFYEPLVAGDHKLPGLHANTQIAKAFGYARVGHATNSPEYLRAAANLWKLVVDNHTYIFGGNSTREHFTDTLHAGFNSEQGPETCNTYNMLRLTNQLLDAPAQLLADADITEHNLLDYYERALFNHILPSQHPRTGGLVYFSPVRPDQYRVYSQTQKCFWCCVGTGMENHARYTELLFSTDSFSEVPAISVNHAIASTIVWEEQGLKLTITGTVSETNEISVRVDQAPDHDVTIRVRLPWWSRRNGQSVWAAETKTWEPGTELRFPVAKRITTHIIEPVESETSVRWLAFQRGPQVLVAPTTTQDLVGLHSDDSRMGHAAQGPMRELATVPFVLAEQPLRLSTLDLVKVIHQDDIEIAQEDPVLKDFLEQHTPTPGNPVIALRVTTADGTPSAVQLLPLEQVHDTRYSMYFPLGLEEEAAPFRERLRELDHATLGELLFTLDHIQCGEQQPESDHGFDGSQSLAQADGTLHWRDALGAGAFFSYQLKTQGEQSGRLSLLVAHQDGPSAVNVTIGGELAHTIELPARPIDSEPPFVVELPVSANDTVAVAFNATSELPTPRIMSVRLLK